MALKDVIKDARLKKNLKQEEAAKLAGVTVQTYSKWENGKTEPKASQVAVISKALSVSTNAICNGKESQKLDMMEFMRLVSKLSQGVSDFEQQMAIWESIDDDYKYIDTLSYYSPIPLETLMKNEP
jgi:transcriptional regulator with XRE-family HTH domain